MRERNESDVLKIVKSIQDWCNPFDLNNVPSDLINICTGKVTESKIKDSLINFLENAKGKVKEHYQNLTKSSFWIPLKRDKVCTFRETNVRFKTSQKRAFIGSELMFRRVISSRCSLKRY